jgi:hypothetical protein
MYTQWNRITNQLYRYSSWDHLERDFYYLFELDHTELKSIPHELTAGSVLVHIEATPKHDDLDCCSAAVYRSNPPESPS